MDHHCSKSVGISGEMLRCSGNRFRHRGGRRPLLYGVQLPNHERSPALLTVLLLLTANTSRKVDGSRRRGSDLWEWETQRSFGRRVLVLRRVLSRDPYHVVDVLVDLPVRFQNNVPEVPSIYLGRQLDFHPLRSKHFPGSTRRYGLCWKVCMI